eukprot:gene8317-9882_t
MITILMGTAASPMNPKSSVGGPSTLPASVGSLTADPAAIRRVPRHGSNAYTVIFEGAGNVVGEGELYLLHEELLLRNASVTVFARSNPNEKLGPPSWDFLWSRRPDTIPSPGALDSWRRTNHVPGLHLLTSKKNLAILVPLANLSGVPATLVSPGEVHGMLRRGAIPPSDLRLSLSLHRAPPPHVPRPEAVSPRCDWLAKSPSHGGVEPLCGPPAAILDRAETRLAGGGIIQAAVRDPLLIDGASFDLGVYVLITGASAATVRARVFSDVLLRFCEAPREGHEGSLPYGGLGGAAAPTATSRMVVGGKYRAAWEMPSLREHFDTTKTQGAGRATWPGRIALEAHLTNVTGDPGAFQTLWRAVSEAVGETLAAVQPAVSSGVEKYWQQEDHFLELLRYDFVVDTNLVPWLVEVNASPNLFPKSAPQEALLRTLCRGVVDAMITKMRQVGAKGTGVMKGG